MSFLSFLPQGQKASYLKTISYAAAYCCLMAFIAIFTRPLLPVDETRYVSVAWEMFSKNEWILPTLNFEPYHHKPPLLFWCIMGLWTIFGVTQKAALALPFLFSFCAIFITGKMATKLYPESPSIAIRSMLILMGTLCFALYSNMVMFDILLSIFALTGLYSGWQLFHTKQWRWIAFIGLSTGLGILAKGPVILLHIYLPLIVFYVTQKTITKNNEQPLLSSGKVTISLITSVIIGAAIGLAWALPAAKLGGPEFEQKIFFGQTADRMVKSFDHARPIWWYLAILPLFLFPWFTWPQLWTSMKNFSQTIKTHPATQFLLCWILPVFIAFSFISGKQPHYLLPIIPALAIAIAAALENTTHTIITSKSLRWPMLILLITSTIPLILGIIPLIHPDWPAWIERPHLSDTIDKISIETNIAIVIAIIATYIWAKRKQTINTHIFAITISIGLVMAGFLLTGRKTFFPNYDLKPLARIIQKNPERPLGFIRNYHGEFSFLAKLDKSVKQMEPHEIDAWFKENPNGLIFIREDKVEDIGNYDIIFSMPYKMTKIYAIITPRGKGNAIQIH